ncbi:hypothetical protein ABMA27_002994 [Loxostege sticticalis]|uniref:Tyr recombinase domain-containing protein n=1 Tax=Loxostege sticticalis TaxID=481309 RepID=A0ABR3HRN1_LOXSC
MSSTSSSESDILTPETIKLEASNVIQNLIPTKSREKYLKAYDNFIQWKNRKGAKTFSENVFLAYFQELAKTKQPSTLWSVYSMLKTTVNINKDIKIDSYSKLVAYLKRLSEGHKPKKSKVFSGQNVETFLNDAPDKEFLAIKVALIFGIHGACRGNELVKITVDDIENHSDQLLLVKLTDTKTKIDRSFIIRGEYKRIVEKYQSLRPSDIKSNRFFIRYQNGKCLKQVLGKNKISSMPQEIATFLKLPDSKLYTGHCFRRTSATLLADSGADLTVLKRHGGWKSSSVAEGYIEDSIESKAKISTSIAENIKLRGADNSPIPLSPRPSTSKESSVPFPEHQPDTEITNTQNINKSTTISIPNKTVTIHFQNCASVSNININL